MNGDCNDADETSVGGCKWILHFRGVDWSQKVAEQEEKISLLAHSVVVVVVDTPASV